jgi:hypothetical protein
MGSTKKQFSQIWLDTRYESREKKEKKHSFIFGYLLEITIKIWRFQFFSLRNLVKLGHFFHEKSFV